MSRLIVIEGPDGAGKSTLVRALSYDMGRPVTHTGGPPKTREEWLDRCMRVRDLADKPVILDRIPHISEQCYGPVCYDRHGPFTDLTKELFDVNPIVVYCRLKSIPAMLQLIGREHKDYKPTEHLQLVIDNYFPLVSAYDKLMDRLELRLKVIRHNWMADSYNTLLGRLRECAA